MAKFTPVRYSGSSKTPVQDGQMLVDTSTGLVSFDTSEGRIRANNVYGITKYVNTNLWILSEGRYYIDITSIVGDSLPSGYSVVGASFLADDADTTLVNSGSSVRLYASDKLEGNLLIFTLPGEGYTEDTGLRGLVALYHLEEDSGTFIDCAGDTTITANTNYTIAAEAKYGKGSVLKNAMGYLEINDLPDLNSFTIEWWQYDPSATGDGGVILADSTGATVSMVTIDPSSSMYVSGAWKHSA